MIVGNLDFHGALLCPEKAHAPLVVDTDAVLAFSVTRQDEARTARTINTAFLFFTNHETRITAF